MASTKRNPLDYVIITREKLEEVLDDAVSRGRMTRDDATRLVGELVGRGRSVTGDVFADIEQLLGRSREQIERTARKATGQAVFPIPGYDDLPAAGVKPALDGLSPAELRKVRDYERRNANRKTVLQAIESKLG
jgi:polyhydroxyalkanoate synthesis regulator phasin